MWMLTLLPLLLLLFLLPLLLLQLLCQHLQPRRRLRAQLAVALLRPRAAARLPRVPHLPQRDAYAPRRAQHRDAAHQITLPVRDVVLPTFVVLAGNCRI
jgi:hypothetical protein